MRGIIIDGTVFKCVNAEVEITISGDEHDYKMLTSIARRAEAPCKLTSGSANILKIISLDHSENPSLPGGTEITIRAIIDMGR